MNDLRYAFRQLVRQPGFAFVAVLTLALGIGANTAIFTVVNGVLLQPLPYPQPERLVTFESNQSAPELEDVAAQNHSFASVGGVGTQAADYTGGAEPVQLELGLTTGDFFATFGAQVQLGRTFGAIEDRLGAPRVIVLTNGLWQRQFASNPAIIGKSATIGGQVYTVIGVTAPDFHPPRPTLEAFVPIHVFYPGAAEARGAHLLRAYARLKPGVSLEQAQSEMRILDQRMAQANPDENKNRSTTLVSLQERMVGNIRPALLVLSCAVGLVLLIACANFANLLLVRVAQRRPELTIRSALGASRGRLIAQVLTESLLLAVLGGGFGLLLGSWGVDTLLAFKPEELPRVEGIHLDGQVLAFTLGLSLLTGLIFGLVPAWQATRVRVNAALSDASRSVTLGRSLGRNALVVAELSLALVLLIGAGLLGNTFYRLTIVAPGFSPQNILSVRVELPEARYRQVAQQTEFRERVLDNLNALPGARAAMISELPLGGDALDHNFLIEGRPPIAIGEEPSLYARSIAGDYFKVMGIPLLRGRALTRDDRAEAPLVGVINDAMVRRYFPGQNPLGQRIRWAREDVVRWITIVGVVGNVHHFGLGQPEEPAIYTPYAQSVQAWKRWSEIVVSAPSALDRAGLTNQIKPAIWKVDPLLAVGRPASMDEVLAVSLAGQRFNTLLLGAFAAMALLLASVGLYGLLAFGVAQRTREFGIRIAVGAERSDVLRMVLRQGLSLTLLGVGLGFVISLGGTRVLAGFLYGVSPTDAPTFAAVALLLLGVSLAACLIPARRATKVDPMIALRYE